MIWPLLDIRLAGKVFGRKKLNGGKEMGISCSNIHRNRRIFMMPMKYYLLILLGWAPTLLPAQQPVSYETRTAVQRTLNYYFQALHLNDLDALARAYHPQAQFTYVQAETGTVAQFSFGRYLATRYDAATHPAHYERELTVLSLDIAGNAAWAKTAITYKKRGMRLIDYLSLVQEQGEWRIISRVSHKEYARFEPVSRAEQRRQAQTAGHLRQVVKAYLTQRRREDWDRMGQSFHPAAQVAYVDPRRQICHTASLPDYLEALGATNRHYQRHDDILAVDHVGDIAVVKVRTQYRRLKGHTLDYLTLVREGGKWHIIHKATHKHPMAMSVPG